MCVCMTWHLKPHPHHHPNRLGAMLNHPASGLFYCQTQKTCEKKQLHITMKFHSSLPSNPTTQPPLPPPPKKKKERKNPAQKTMQTFKVLWFCSNHCYYYFLLFTTVLSQWDFSDGKFGLPSLGKTSCNRVALPNLWCMLGVLVFP